MKKIFVSLLLTLMLVSCRTVEDNQFTVYTSFWGMYDFAREIAGDKAAVEVLIPSGMEAHDWEPSAKDMVNLSKADVFIYSGKNMEPWAEKVIESAENSDLKVIEASKGIKTIENKTATDPHVWLNPQNAIIELENITKGLAEKDPENAEYYQENFRKIKAEIEGLDQNFRDALAGFKNKDILVTHGAFGYLCDTYGLKQYPIEGMAGGSDPSPASLKSVIDYIRDNEIKAIFYVENEEKKVAEMLRGETGVDILPLDPFERSTQNKGYIEVMRGNLENIEKALR